jgi:hypothetical protein
MVRKERKERRAIDGNRINGRLSFIRIFIMTMTSDIEPRLRLAFMLRQRGRSSIAGYNILRYGKLLL